METILNKEKFLEIFIRLVFIIGLISLSVAVVMFVAYNWSDFGKLQKFALLQSAFTVPVVLLMLVKNDIIKDVLIITASILIGANLALIGQVYQTGADTWQLFAFWALLLLPFAYVQRSISIYLFFIVIVNIASYLYYDIYRWFYYLFGHSYMLIGVVINIVFWQISIAMKNRLLELILAIVVFAQFTLFSVKNILEKDYYLQITYLIFMGIIFIAYRVKKINLFYMQLFTVTAAISFLTLLGHILFNNIHEDLAIIFISFVMLIALVLTTLASYRWIENLKEKADE